MALLGMGRLRHRTLRKETRTSHGTRSTTGAAAVTMTAIGEAMMAEAKEAGVASTLMIGAEIRLVAPTSSLT